MPDTKTGILLVNIGTPDDASPAAVGRYLGEFLMDPQVIDIPWLFRWLLVKVAIVPKRKMASAKLYQKVWTEQGSPLLNYSKAFRAQLAQRLPAVQVEIGMRYGNPGIEAVLKKFKSSGIEKLIVVPLYPQFSAAATRSSELRVKALLKRISFAPVLSIVPPFYNNEHYLDAVAAVSAPYLRKSVYDLFVFSYHGLPERQVVREDKKGTHCLKSEDCSERAVEANQNCYRHQCFETSRLLAQKLGIPPMRYIVAFQSRLGRTPWIQPYTDAYYRSLPSQGIKRLAVLCPSFVADCLETLEEVQIRGREEYRANGGDELKLVPSLNGEPVWADAMVKILNPYLI